MLNLEQFRATKRQMTPAEFAQWGESFLDLDLPESVSFLVYSDSYWIAETRPGFFWLLIEREEHESADLAQLESILWAFAQVEFEYLETEGGRSDHFTAAELAGLKAYLGPEYPRFFKPSYDAADNLCRAFMAMRPDLAPASFDEWLAANAPFLSNAETVAGYAILALHPDYRD